MNNTNISLVLVLGLVACTPQIVGTDAAVPLPDAAALRADAEPLDAAVLPDTAAAPDAAVAAPDAAVLTAPDAAVADDAAVTPDAAADDAAVAPDAAVVPTPGAPMHLGAAGEGTCVLDDRSQMWCWGTGHRTPRFIDVVTSLTGTCGVALDGSLVCLEAGVVRRFAADAILAGVNHGCYVDRTGVWRCGTVSWTPPSPILEQSTSNCAILASGYAWCWDRQVIAGVGAITNMRDAGAAADIARLGQLYDGTHRACMTRATGVFCEDERTVFTVDLLRRGVEVEAYPGRFCAIVEVEWSGSAFGGPYLPHPAGVHCTTDAFRALSPADVIGPYTNILGSQLALGSNHICLLHEGAVMCWGDNSFGQLGDGTTTATRTPVAVVW